MRGAGFETIDYRKIQREMYFLDADIQDLLEESEGLSASSYVDRVLRIHHRMTVIHPFRDGNGRTTRAFTNLLLGMRGLPPVLFQGNRKAEYKKSLAAADESGEISDLFVVYCKQMLETYSALASSQ